MICHNPDPAARDAEVRANLIEHLEELITGSDEWSPRRRDELVGALKSKPGLRRYLRRTKTGRLRVDQAAAKKETGLDGKWLLRTSDPTLSADDPAAYKQLLADERGWRDMKGSGQSSITVKTASEHTYNCAGWPYCSSGWWRTPPTTPGATSVTSSTVSTRSPLATHEGTVAQRTTLTAGHKTILTALELPEPRRYYDFSTAEA